MLLEGALFAGSVVGAMQIAARRKAPDCLGVDQQALALAACRQGQRLARAMR